MAHIPSAPTGRLELVTFRQALAAANTPSEDYSIERWIYAPNFYSEYRYILGTRGEKPLICIGINPSTARPDALDNTLKSVERIALGNGYDSFIMFNVYAQRATRPRDMEREPNLCLHRENMAAFAYALSLSPSPAVWAATPSASWMKRIRTRKTTGNGCPSWSPRPCWQWRRISPARYGTAPLTPFRPATRPRRCILCLCPARTTAASCSSDRRSLFRRVLRGRAARR